MKRSLLMTACAVCTTTVSLIAKEMTPVVAQPALVPRPLPSPAHSDYGTFRWTSAPYKYSGTGSDMHWWAWTSDGALLIIDEDGRNFDGPWSFGHVLRVTGTPPAHRVEEIAVLNTLGLKDGIEPGAEYTGKVEAKGFSRYVGGPVAVGDKIYVSVYDYTWRVPGLPKENFDNYFAHGGLVGFILSEDGGKTWCKLFQDGDSYLLGERFTALQFIHFGPGGSGTPDHLKGWLYAVSNDSNWESGNHLFLARVRPNALEKRASWEFFAGFRPGRNSTEPAWTTRENEARAILSDPGHVGHSTMSYNPARRSYWLAVFSDTVPHRTDTPVAVAHATWDVATELQLYEGPQPWGPWQLLHDERPWGGPQHAAYLPMIPTPWIDHDGQGATFLFTGDWAKHGHAWYGFMTQSFRLGRTEKDPAKVD